MTEAFYKARGGSVLKSGAEEDAEASGGSVQPGVSASPERPKDI